MRGFHDEMGGPESVAGPEWGELGWGDGVTAAGLPASPGAPSALPSEKLTWEETQHSEMLRHNFLLRRHLTDPGYGASRELSWREKAANGLGVPCVPERARISRGPASFRGGVEKLVASPSDNPRRDLGLPSE